MRICCWGNPESLSATVVAKSLESKELKVDWLSGDAQSVGTQFKNYDLGIILDGNALEAGKFVSHRSVGGHFLRYFDFIVNRSGVLWGETVFANSFHENLLGAFKNQNFKGPVIFLGDKGRALPIFETLAGFGFTDFDFLSLGNESPSYEHISRHVSGLFDTTVAQVDSASFVRSQKEYSLCFVAKDDYQLQTLDDMSYFHFLSNRSIVFDLSGRSNFLFKEVQALGVEVVDYMTLEDNFASHIVKKIAQNS